MAVKNKAIQGFGRTYALQTLGTLAFLAFIGALGYTLTILAQR